MIAVLALATLASAALLGTILSSENFLAIAFAGIGLFVLFPLAISAAVLSIVLMELSGLIPVLGTWGGILGGFVDGAYGVTGWYYLAVALPLWFAVMFQFANGSDTSASSTVSGSKTDDDRDSPESSVQSVESISETNDGTDNTAFTVKTDVTEVDNQGSSSTDEATASGEKYSTVKNKRGAPTSERQQNAATEEGRDEQEVTESTAEANGSKDELTSPDTPSASDLIDELQLLDDDTEGYPLTTYLREEGNYKPHKYYNEFGSWEEALEAADIDKEQRLIEDIQSVAEIVGKPPTTSDMDEHGVHSSGVHSTHFDSWSTALELADVGDDRDEADTEAEESTQEGRSTESDENVSAVNTTEDASGETSAQELVDEIQRPDNAKEGQTPSFATIGEITEDGRIAGQLAVKVTNFSKKTGAKKQASLLVEDIDGNQCRLNVWQKHDVTVSWKSGHWYLLEQARGKHWTDKRGKANRQLSSTKDLQVTYVGVERPEETDDGTVSSVGTSSGRESSTDGDSGSEGTTLQPNGAEDSESSDKRTGGGSNEDEPDNEILDEVIDEFDEITGLDS